MQKWNFACWRWSFYLACSLYALSWLLGIIVTLTFAPQQVLQHVQISPGQTHDAWYYISHNIAVAGVLLLGACTCGIGTGLILCLNGFFDGVIATAIVSHYGLAVLLAGLLPHGLFEACAWVLISSCGFLLGGRFKRLISSLWNNRSMDMSERAQAKAYQDDHKSERPQGSPLQWTNKPAKRRRAIVGAHPCGRPGCIDNMKNVYLGLAVASTLLLVLAGTIEAYVSPMLVKVLLISTR